MKFDKTRVYTAVNADELPIGSKCIFADTFGELKKAVEENGEIETLKDVYSEYEEYRFKPINSGRSVHSLAYLVVPPKQAKKQKEPQYKPFSSIEKAMEIVKKHGGWIRNKEKDEICLVTGVTNSDFGIIVYLAGYYGINSTKLIHERFSFFDDGSPCGELAEE